MPRGSLIVMAVAALTAFPLSAADPATARQVAPPLAENRGDDLRALFERAPGVIADNENGITVEGFATEVVLARVGPDGKLVKACVDNHAAARRFLDTPVEKVDREAQDQ